MVTDFVVKISREFQSEHCISGYLSVDGHVICHSLELPWRDNETDRSSIPIGSYATILRYDHNDNWRIELIVPGRPNIQIHIGNTVDDTKGCILVGLSVSNDLCTVNQSAAAYAILKKTFYGSENPNATPDKNIQVIVE